MVENVVVLVQTSVKTLKILTDVIYTSLIYMLKQKNFFKHLSSLTNYIYNTSMCFQLEIKIITKLISKNKYLTKYV